MYTLEGKPATIVTRWIVRTGEHAGQEFAEIVCDGERHYIPVAWLTQHQPRVPEGTTECHYCGGPAHALDFFGAPVCNDCR